MKKLLVVASVASAIFATNAIADEVTAQATATWKATATKDTQSELVVTALDSLAFQYAEGINGFNTQDGAFEITIQGQDSATDFELSAKIVSSQLLHASGPSTLGVGALWNGDAITTIDRVIAGTSTDYTAGLEPLFTGNAYSNAAERTSAISSFKFFIEDATADGSTPLTDYSDLPDGYWSGDVKVQFTAVWTV